jgi:hypothetical protein
MKTGEKKIDFCLLLQFQAAGNFTVQLVFSQVVLLSINDNCK